MTETELNGRMVESRELDEENQYRTPGATARLRGVEANTAMTNGFPNDANLTGTVEGNDLAIGGTSWGDADDAQTNTVF
jgi:hypothetical protein